MKTRVMGTDASSRALLTGFLEAWGYEVVPAGIGTDTAAVPGHADAPVLVLVDESLPEFDAWQVCHELRTVAPDGATCLVVLTDRTAPADLVALYEAGADECVSRPWNPELLRVRLEARVRWRAQHRRTEETLRASEHHLRQILTNAPFGGHFYHLDSAQRLIFDGFNPAAERILGVDHQALLGQAIDEAFPGLVGPDLLEIYQVIALEGGSWFQEQVIRDAGETLAALEVHAFNPEPGRLAVFFKDILERRTAEEALAQSRERLAVTLRSIVDGVVTTDMEGRVATLNQAAERLTGWTMTEAVGRPVGEIFCLADDSTMQLRESAVATVLRTGSGAEPGRPSLLLSRNGHHPLVEDRATPILDDNGRAVGVVLVVTDVTERHKIMENLQRTQRLDSLGVLAGGIAHDFNNLLGGLFGYIDMARSGLRGAGGTHVHSCLDKAIEAFERARALTQQLLTFSKGGAPVRRPADIAVLLRDNAHFALSGSKVTCAFELADALWPCNVDENQVGQVIHNLVLNAIQAMPAGGEIRLSAANVRLDPGTDPLLTAGGPFVEFSVRDNGPGIAADLLPRIFDPFFTTKECGSGLGLATCHSIMRQHGGRIDVESEPGQGTRFRLLLPAEPLVIAEKSRPKVVQHVGSGRVLVLDDEVMIRDLLRDMLRSMGYDVVCTSRGQEAIDAFVQAELLGRSFKVAIVDLTLPGDTESHAVVAEMRGVNPAVRFVASSGYCEDPAMADPGGHGFVASLRKPYRLRDLAALMERVSQEGREQESA